MAETRTKRDKLRAMAAQTASPEEAAVAKAMLRKTANTPEERLEVIAYDINVEWGKGIDAQFAVGRLLLEARTIIESDKLFGQWLDAQPFGFSRQTAGRLREAAEREPEVRAFIATRSERSGKDIGVPEAIKLLNAGPKPVADGSDGDDAGELIPVTDATPAHPGYAALRAAHQALLGSEESPTNGFDDMHVDDMTKSAAYIMDIANAYKQAKAKREAHRA